MKRFFFKQLNIINSFVVALFNFIVLLAVVDAVTFQVDAFNC